jgi:LysM repeat protein
MKKKISLILLAVFIGALFIFSSVSVGSAMPNLQTTPFPTPTPGPDGRILYIVQPGDTLWDIAAISGVPIDELRSLNNMEDGDVVIPGQILILSVQGQQGDGTGDDVDPVDVSLTPEATLPPGNGTICILLYEDKNGDSFRQEMETSIADGAVSVTEKFGLHSESATTAAGDDPVCFEEIPEGEYNISVALPENYNPTTIMTTTLALYAGDTSYVNFGGQFTGKAIVDDGEGGSAASLLMGIGGILLVLGGAGLGTYTLFRGRRVETPKK